MTSPVPLPHALVRAILDFVVDGNDFPPWPRVARDVFASTSCPSSSPPISSQDNHVLTTYDAFISFARVCRDWHVVARDAACARALKTIVLDIHEPPSRSSALALRNRFLWRRTRLKCVRVLAPSSLRVGDGQAQWKAVLSHAPQLTELEVSSSPLHSLDGVVDILRAVAEHGPKLQILRLPTFNPYAMHGPTSEFVSYRRRNAIFDRARDLSDLVQAVYACVEAKSSTSSVGAGLTSLHLPLGLFMRNPLAHANIYLDKITRCCPKIQVLDGYRDSVVNYDPVFCREQWMVRLETWRRFCSTCVELTAFSWMCVPFATAYFEIFGETVKPHLTKLELVAPRWDWDRFQTTVDATTHAVVQDTGFAATAKHVHHVLRACPRLKELQVIWSFDTGGTPPVTMNPEVFGDDFCSEVARHCKDLRKLTIISIPARVDPSVSIQQFTDKAMQSLSTLPQLCEVSLGGCNITGDGLFDLVIAHAAETRHTRVYDIRLGDSWRRRMSATAHVFYDSLMRLLERLSDVEGPLPCASHAVSLTLQNGHIDDMDEAASAAYLTRVRALAARVERRHPSVTMRGIVEGYVAGGGFHTIERFQLSTGASCCWLQDSQSGDGYIDAPLDSVFVSRTYWD